MFFVLILTFPFDGHCSDFDFGEPRHEAGAEDVHGLVQVVVLDHQVEVALHITVSDHTNQLF